MSSDQVQWGALVECLPWEEGERPEETRREMWSLFNLNDNPTLREQDLVQGVTTVCQQASQEFFDFYPAVRVAFNYTKVYYNNGEEQDENNSGSVLVSKVNKTLTYEEFRIFFFALRQYFMYCQVFENNDMDDGHTIRKSKFTSKEVVDELKDWVGEDFDAVATFAEMDGAGSGMITFGEVSQWAMMKNVQIEVDKKKQKEREAEEANEEEETDD